MNIPESTSENEYTTCKRQENGDGTAETDRPLKKARFAWQVKGKYHLKNEISDNRPKVSSIESNDASSSLENESATAKETGSNDEPNLEILGDLIKKDLRAFDTLNEPDQQILPKLDVSRDNLSYTRYISSAVSESINTSENVNINNVPDSLLNSNKALEDQCIAEWQARQMAKCFVDNTINALIDSWMRGPLLTDIDDDRFTVFGGPEPHQNISNDDSIENEGILMAISAHGLQNNSSASNYSLDENLNTNSTTDIFLSPPSSPYSESIDSNYNLKRNYFSNLKSVDVTQETDSQEISNYSCQTYDDNENTPMSQVDYEADNATNNHFDFLDTAVSFAIQYKGLTSYGTDYG